MRRLQAAQVFLLLAGMATPALGQFVNEAGEVLLRVPRAPLVKSPIKQLLLVGAKEVESDLVAKALQFELSRQPAFKALLPEEGDPLAKETKSLEDLSRERREQLAAKYGASHVMWIRLEHFNFKEKSSSQVVNTVAGSIVYYRWLGAATGILQCPVMDLTSGTVTSIVPQNLQKQYSKESENVPPLVMSDVGARNELVQIATRKALQMVVSTLAVQPMPFLTQGSLDKVLATLKQGKLDEATDQLKALAAAADKESPKYKARIQYDLGLLLCLGNRPTEALEHLREAQAAGYDKSEVGKALGACEAMLGEPGHP